MIECVSTFLPALLHRGYNSPNVYDKGENKTRTAEALAGEAVRVPPPRFRRTAVHGT